MVARIAGMSSSFKVPSLSSSRTLLSGTRARPNPAWTRRFCAVRLSISVIFTSSTPIGASSRSRRRPNDSRPRMAGNPTHFALARCRFDTRFPTLAEIAEDLVRGALADHPDEQAISLLAISVSNLDDHSTLQLEFPLGLADEERRPGAKKGMARLVV